MASPKDEWRTPPDVLAAARYAMGRIDLVRDLDAGRALSALSRFGPTWSKL